MKTIIAILLVAALAGCIGDTEEPTDLEFDGENWPDLSGQELVILSHESFAAFEEASALFENLTGIDDVELQEAGDTGSALAAAVRSKGRPTADLIYGLDNAYLHIAMEEEILQQYQPVLAANLLADTLVFGNEWYATPTDQGYVGINWDPDGPGMENVTIESLFDLREHADNFVTQSPKSSSPGLGFLLITISAFPENNDGFYDWKEYWGDLVEGGVLITNGWSEAYEDHFSGGYGAAYGGAADKAIVNSYTESPAYEAYFGTDEGNLSIPLIADGTTWRQIQTTAILHGAENLEAAQAWIEFTLTDAYQELAAVNGVYPVTEGVDTDATYGDVDPQPGTFNPITLDFATIGTNLERWICEWDLIAKGEEPDCA